MVSVTAFPAVYLFTAPRLLTERSESVFSLIQKRSHDVWRDKVHVYCLNYV
uniref:Uncharacterized protein n=1 Tax=Anguilla anguilla TaxID=7936 RepID=A0A0E9RB18_ANGAN